MDTSTIRRGRAWQRLTAVVAAGALSLGLAAATAAPASAGAAPAPSGERSLAEVLTSDGNTFDRKARDYDILTEAVLAVIDAKPDSPVALLADGSVPLTAFIPNDFAFRVLVKDLTGRWYWSERKVFTKLVEAVGVDAVETVLLYHVVPGATIDARAALRSDGVALDTAQGGQFTVDVISRRWGLIRLRDNDRNDIDPFLLRRELDINQGNKQIAHGILFVLRPIDL